MHSNLQVTGPLKHFCTKLLDDHKEFHPETFPYTLYTCILLGILIAFFAVHCFRHKKLHNLQVEVIRFPYRCKIHWAAQTTCQQKTEEMSSFPYIWHKDERSVFKIWQGLKHHPMSLGMRVHTSSISKIIVYYVN